MIKWYVLLLMTLIMFIALSMKETVLAEQVQCNHCDQINPCVTVLEFKEIKFAHNVYCWIDKEGSEHWTSEDKDTLELYYNFSDPPRKGKERNDLDI